MLGRWIKLLPVACAAACLESLSPAESCDPHGRVIDGVCVRCEAPLVFVGDACRACPSPAEVELQSCLPVVQSGPAGDGCLGDLPDAFSCLTGGPPEECVCDPDECAAASACWDDGACPPEVIASAPDAVCVGLSEDRLSWYAGPYPTANPDPAGCLCGCTRCALRCDGRGLVYGAFDDNALPLTHVAQGLAIDLDGLLPEAGTIGFYVRERGWSTLAVIVSTGDPILDLVAACFAPVVNDFSQTIAFAPTDECSNVTAGLPQPYLWEAAADTPRVAVLPITFDSDDGSTPEREEDPTIGILEIDCIVPFYVPAP